MCPTFPTFNANRNINANIAAPLRNEASEEFDSQQKIISTLQAINKEWSKANDVMQYTESKAKWGVAAAEITARADSDPNFKDSDKYHKELEAAKKNSLGSISNAQIQGQLMSELNYDYNVAKIKIDSGFKNKQMAYNKAMVSTNLDLLMQKKLASITEAEAMKQDQEINNLLDSNLKSGILTYEEADKLLKDSRKTSVQYEIYSDPSRQESESRLLTDLKNPKGKYSYLDPDTRLKLIEESQRRIFQNNQSFKREVEVSQNDRTVGMIEKMATQTATFKDIDKEFAIPEEQGGMKRSILLSYQKYLQSGVEKTLNEYLREKNPDTKEVTKRSRLSKEYNDLIEFYLDDKSDQWKAKEALAKGLADGVIDPKEQKILYPLKDNLNDIKLDRNTSRVGDAIRSIKSWWRGQSVKTEEDLAINIKQLLNGVAEGKDPQAEMKNIMDNNMLKNFPDHQSYPNEGKEFLDKKSGRTYKVYPDGRWTWSVSK